MQIGVNHFGITRQIYIINFGYLTLLSLKLALHTYNVLKGISSSRTYYFRRWSDQFPLASLLWVVGRTMTRASILKIWIGSAGPTNSSAPTMHPKLLTCCSPASSVYWITNTQMYKYEYSTLMLLSQSNRKYCTCMSTCVVSWLW